MDWKRQALLSPVLTSDNLFIKVNRCPAAASLVNGARSCDGQEDNVDGSVCTYTCVIGYELQGSGTVTCNRNSWSSPFPTCASESRAINNTYLLSPLTMTAVTVLVTSDSDNCDTKDIAVTIVLMTVTF